MKKKTTQKKRNTQMPTAGPTTFLQKNTGKWMNRILIGIPMTGLVRAEWIGSRYGQIIPTNWSHVEVQQWLSSYIPLEHQLADAENLMAKLVVEGNFEWFLSIEHDNILPNNTFIKLNEYMIEGKIPIVAGLYFTKSVPPEPILYRGRGTGHFADFKLGEKVWVDGIPFGCTLIHGSIIKALWDESPEYTVNGQVTRRVFDLPAVANFDPEGNSYSNTGTSDLAFCTRIMKDRIFEKAGWPEFQKMQYPFLVDTSIFVKHITTDGVQYPLSVPEKFKPTNNA